MCKSFGALWMAWAHLWNAPAKTVDTAPRKVLTATHPVDYTPVTLSVLDAAIGVSRIRVTTPKKFPALAATHPLPTVT